MALPNCGLYRTGVALPGREEQLPAERLVYFHNHSKEGGPLVLPPRENTHNHWTFADRGYLVQGPGSEGFMEAMIALPRQGFYVVQRPIALSDGTQLPPRALVQVGYNGGGDAILFVPEGHGNGFWFPERGFRFDGLGIFESLREAGFDRPAAPVQQGLLH